jgi:hypothetical protein
MAVVTHSVGYRADEPNQGNAWIVGFGDGSVTIVDKTGFKYVRAVR